MTNHINNNIIPILPEASSLLPGNTSKEIYKSSTHQRKQKSIKLKKLIKENMITSLLDFIFFNNLQYKNANIIVITVATPNELYGKKFIFSKKAAICTVTNKPILSMKPRNIALNTALNKVSIESFFTIFL